MLSFGILIAFLITKEIRDWGELWGILGKAIGSSETWRTEALKSFSISKSGMQGEKVKRICHEAYSWWQSCQPLLEHFLKSSWCMLYVISTQEVNNLTLQTVRNLELKRRSYSHCKSITLSWRKHFAKVLRNHPFVAKWFRSLFVQCGGFAQIGRAHVWTPVT